MSLADCPWHIICSNFYFASAFPAPTGDNHPLPPHMHRFRSKSTILRFKLAALLLCSKYFLVPATAGILVYSFIQSDAKLTLVAISLGIFTVLLMISQWIVAARTRCPLCLTPVLADKNCSTHRHARTTLGSHRLRVALAVLLRGSFSCPYCHERSAMQVRDGHR